MSISNGTPEAQVSVHDPKEMADIHSTYQQTAQKREIKSKIGNEYTVSEKQAFIKYFCTKKYTRCIIQYI
jgi:hypothetical protein